MAAADVKPSSAVGPSWSKGRTVGHIFGREPSNDYFIKILFLLSKWFQKRRFLWEFPIGSRLPTKMAAKLKIEKGGMKFKKKSSLKLLSQSQPNFPEMILGWC
jgi:hypothetical protein